VPAARLVARAAGVLLVLMLMPSAVRAQALTPQPPGPFVIDIRGTTLGVPQGADFYPDIPGETIVPARGFGLQAGAQVYPWALGSKRIGLGADFFLVRGTATTPVTTSTSTTTESTTTPVTPPDVKVTMAIASPQLSMNFGSSRGWSYLTVGGGGASVKTSAGSLSLATTALDINAGAGARWFLSDHLGLGFDLRVHWVGGNAMFGASAGFSLN
jgi:hypothetical protein